MESRTRYALLGALAEGPSSVYAVKQALAASVGHFWHESFGQLYPTLKKLEAEGLVILQEEGGPRDRKIYAITPEGLDALRLWLEEPSEYLPPQRNEFLLKLFFGGHAAPDVTLARIQRFAERNRATLATYEGILRAIEANPTPSERQPYMSTTLFFGMASARSALAWSEEAIRFLERRDAPTHRETEE